MSQPISLVAGFISGIIAWQITRDFGIGVMTGFLVATGIVMLSVAPRKLD